jgi:hypothetical protein
MLPLGRYDWICPVTEITPVEILWLQKSGLEHKCDGSVSRVVSLISDALRLRVARKGLASKVLPAAERGY